MSIKLRNVKGKYSWCGPSAISAVTGIDSTEAARQIESHWSQGRIKQAKSRLKKRNDKRAQHKIHSVSGTYLSDLIPVLSAHDIAVIRHRDGVLAQVRKSEWRRRKVSPYSQAACCGETDQQYLANLDETLSQWCERTIDERGFKRIFLIAAGVHWIVIQGNRFVCGQTRKVTNIWDKGVHRRARVEAVMELIESA